MDDGSRKGADQRGLKCPTGCFGTLSSTVACDKIRAPAVRRGLIIRF